MKGPAQELFLSYRLIDLSVTEATQSRWIHQCSLAKCLFMTSPRRVGKKGLVVVEEEGREGVGGWGGHTKNQVAFSPDWECH